MTSPCLARWMNGTVQLTNPVQFPIGSSLADRDPFITPDDLQLYWSSDENGGDIFVTSRASSTGAWEARKSASDLNSGGYDSRVSMTRNQLLAVVSAARTGGAGSTDLWLASRSDTASQFGNYTRTPFGATNDIESQLDPEINADGTRVYFANGTVQKIVVISRPNTSAAFGAPQTLLSVPGDADPAVSRDERLILFSSARVGGVGGGDLWYTTRADATTTTLDTPRLVPTVNAAISAEGDPSLSADGCTLYFASNRSGLWKVYSSSVML